MLSLFEFITRSSSLPSLQGVSQAWDTALYVVFPNQRNVVFSQLGKETKSYNKKITESKTNSKKRYEK